MDVVFDIDGTLADATHRLHFIKDPAHWKSPRLGAMGKPDWESFLHTDQVSQDSSIEPIWNVLHALKAMQHRIIFITGRPAFQRDMTNAWLKGKIGPEPELREAVGAWFEDLVLYMRRPEDRRPSSVVKLELLQEAIADGYNPTLVFEDRNDDTKMWRDAGLLCCQVADGNY